MYICANCFYVYYGYIQDGWIQCNDCERRLCRGCCIGTIFCQKCIYKIENKELKNKEKKLMEKVKKFKKENELLKQQLIEFELRPPELGGKLYLETKKHFDSSIKN